MTSLMTRLWNDDAGQDMAEYAIMLGIVAAVVTAAVLSGFATAVETAIKNVTADL